MSNRSATKRTELSERRMSLVADASIAVNRIRSLADHCGYMAEGLIGKNGCTEADNSGEEHCVVVAIQHGIAALCKFWRDLTANPATFDRRSGGT